MSNVTEEMETQAQAHVVGLLNEVEAVLSGWVLGYDREKVAELTGPLYQMCDQKSPARARTREEGAVA